MLPRDRLRIRRATPDDAPSLARLRWSFRSTLGPVPPEGRVRFLARCRRWMRRALTDGSWRAWVASRDGEIVGAVWAALVEKLPNPVGEPERHGYVSSLFVDPAARGGVGTRLIASCLAWLERCAVDEIVLWPTDASRALYRRFGFAPARHAWTRSPAAAGVARQIGAGARPPLPSPCPRRPPHDAPPG